VGKLAIRNEWHFIVFARTQRRRYPGADFRELFV
jgi:hypothetical protein